MPDDAAYFKYQKQVNARPDQVASHVVIARYIGKFGEDYRYEDKQSAEKTLRDRKTDNMELGRVKGK